MVEEQKRWIQAMSIALVIFAVLTLYLFLRRGYVNLYIVNKSLGSTAVMLAGISLLVGLLSKHITALTPLMTIRRQLGLVAFFFALAHITASLIQQERFPFPKWYLEELLPVAMGVVAILAWGFMTYISRNEKIKSLGVDIWKKRLSLGGQIAFLAIFLHLIIMKYPGWLRWLNGQTRQTPELANPAYPPASLFIFLFMVVVIVYRVGNSLYTKINQRPETLPTSNPL